jgi:acetyl-CoA acetyltransferase
MRTIIVAGVGMTPFVRSASLRASVLAGQAARQALSDCAIDPRRIEAIFVGSARSTAGLAQRTLLEIGLSGIPAFNVENACASGSSALYLGWLAIAAGQHEIVLIVGADTLSLGGSGPLALDDEAREEAPALTLPAWYALKANRLIHTGAATTEDIALVTVKNREQGALNPYAQQRTPVTLEAVLTSRMIADPLTLLQCCPASDGAAAVVLCSEQVARSLGVPPVRIAGIALLSGRPHGTEPDVTARAAQKAYEQAGIGPEDVSVAEVHDAFSVAELLHYESLGFCAPGEGTRLLRDRVTWLGGRLPVSPGGGLLARGHPPGATGLAQVAELTWQLRRQAGARQVEGARVGLAHTQGATVPTLEANATQVTLLAL